MQEKTKFVILFPARSGSTLIMSAINRHRDIFCAAEIFNLTKKYRGKFSEMEDTEDPKEQIEVAYAKGVEEKGETKVVGFKLAYPQVESTRGIYDILKQENYKIVHVYRKRVLERMVSLKLAQQTDIWSKIKWEKEKSAYDTLTMTLPRQEVLNFIRRDQENLDKYRAMFSENFDFFETHYARLIGDNQVAEVMKVQSFLGVSPEPFEPYIGKQNNRPLSAIIENYDEVGDLEKVEIM